MKAPVNMKAPVILMGMHRSGTSLVARLLRRFGVFVGAHLDPNLESVFFQDINEWLLRESGGSWTFPDAIDYLLDNDESRTLTCGFLGMVLRSPRAISYTGLRRYLRWGGLHRFESAWGWKDPRNTFTLPLWLELFPDAKVVSVARHGLDVAQSLKLRRDRRQAVLKSKVFKFRRYYSLWLRGGWFADAPLCATLDGGLSLWAKYMERARVHVERLGEQALSLRYEDLMEQPEFVLGRLVEFCGLDVTSAQLAAVRQLLDPARAYAYRDSALLVDTALDKRALLERFGYGV